MNGGEYEINSEVRAKFEETSPTGVFLIERGVAHVQTYQKVKAELAILGSIGDEVAAHHLHLAHHRDGRLEFLTGHGVLLQRRFLRVLRPSQHPRCQ